MPGHYVQTSSAKPEVHNVSQRRQRKTEPWQLQATCIANLVKFEVWTCGFETRSRTDKQTDRQTTLIAILGTLPYRRQSKTANYTTAM